LENLIPIFRIKLLKNFRSFATNLWKKIFL